MRKMLTSGFCVIALAIFNRCLAMQRRSFRLAICALLNNTQATIALVANFASIIADIFKFATRIVAIISRCICSWCCCCCSMVSELCCFIYIDISVSGCRRCG